MSYWVYEDDPTKRVRVHKAGCSRCKNGRGMKGSRLPDNRWSGPYETEGQAVEQALRTGQPDAKGCWFSLGGLGPLR